MLQSKLLIMFPQGGSGNFLANWLTDNDSILDFRHMRWIDQSGININRHKVSIRFDDNLPSRYMSLCGIITDIDPILENEHQKDFFLRSITYSDRADVRLIITHIFDEERLINYLPYETRILKIWPLSNRFGFYKSALTKMFKSFLDDYEHKNIGRFEHLYNTIEMYNNFFDTAPQPHDLIDYADLLDIDYLTSLHESLLGNLPSDTKRRWAEEYIANQPKSMCCDHESDYHEIRKDIYFDSLLDVAILLFIYEKNNPHLRRCWSIDDVPSDMESALVYIDQHSKDYYSP